MNESDKININKIIEFKKNLTKNILEMALSAGANSSHFGGALSVADIISTLFVIYVSIPGIDIYGTGIFIVLESITVTINPAGLHISSINFNLFVSSVFDNPNALTVVPYKWSNIVNFSYTEFDSPNIYILSPVSNKWS